MDTHHVIEETQWTDYIAVAVAFASMVVLATVATFIIGLRRKPSMRLVGTSYAIACIGAIIHINATLVTNGYLHAFDPIRTVSCVLWDYFFTVSGFALFFGATAASMISARLARIAAVSSRRINTATGKSLSNCQEDSSAEEAAYNTPFERLHAFYGGGRALPAGAVVEDDGSLFIPGNRILNGFNKILRFNGRGNSVFVLEGSEDEDEDDERGGDDDGDERAGDRDGEECMKDEDADEDEMSAEVMDDVFITPPLGFLENDRDDRNDSDGAQHVDDEYVSDPLQARIGEKSFTLFGTVVFVRMGWLLRGLFDCFTSVTGVLTPTQSTKLSGAAVWIFVGCTGGLIILLSLLPSATTWIPEANSCYSEGWLKILFLGALFTCFLVCVVVLLVYGRIQRSEYPSFDRIVEISTRIYRMPFYALNNGSHVGAAEDDSDMMHPPADGDGDATRRGAVRSAFYAAARRVIEGILGVMMLANCCGALFSTRAVPQSSVFTLNAGYSSLDGGKGNCPSHVLRYVDCTVLHMSSGDDAAATSVAGSYGHSYIAARRPSAALKKPSILAFMHVRHAAALWLFAVGLIFVMVPLNVTGYVATSLGRDVFMVAECAVYVGAVYLVVGRVIYDIVFCSNKRFTFACSMLAHAQDTPRTIQDAWEAGRTDIIRDFRDYVTLYCSDDIFVGRWVTRENNATKGAAKGTAKGSSGLSINRVEPGVTASRIKSPNGLLYVDKLNVLVSSKLDNAQALSFASNAMSDQGETGSAADLMASMQETLIKGYAVDARRPEVSAESVSGARYRLPALHPALVRAISTASISGPVASTAYITTTPNDIVSLAMILLGILYWTSFIKHNEERRSYRELTEGTTIRSFNI